MRPVCSGDMYARVPAIVSGGSGAWRSRGRSEAIPKPVSQTWSDPGSTITLAGFMSLWMMPCSWSLPSAVERPMAMRRNRVRSNRRSRNRSRGSPPGSSSTSIVRPSSRTRARGKTAHAGSSLLLSPYSCSSRLWVPCAGCFDQGATTRIWPVSLWPRYRTNSPSFRSDSNVYDEISVMAVSSRIGSSPITREQRSPVGPRRRSQPAYRFS